MFYVFLKKLSLFYNFISFLPSIREQLHFFDTQFKPYRKILFVVIQSLFKTYKIVKIT